MYTMRIKHLLQKMSVIQSISTLTINIVAVSRVCVTIVMYTTENDFRSKMNNRVIFNNMDNKTRRLYHG